MRVGANCKCLQLCSDPFFYRFFHIGVFQTFFIYERRIKS
nr:MAG TPA: hypothetical protein [Caudoviricetes sp.]